MCNHVRIGPVLFLMASMPQFVLLVMKIRLGLFYIYHEIHHSVTLGMGIIEVLIYPIQFFPIFYLSFLRLLYGIILLLKARISFPPKVNPGHPIDRIDHSHLIKSC